MPPTEMMTMPAAFAEWTPADLRRALSPPTRVLFFAWLASRLDPRDFARLEPILRGIIAWDDADPEDNHRH